MKEFLDNKCHRQVETKQKKKFHFKGLPQVRDRSYYVMAFGQLPYHGQIRTRNREESY